MVKKIALPNWFVVTTLLASFSFVFFLCYIDEGYYDFRWMKNIGNWIVFFMYWMMLFWLIIAIGFGVKATLRS